MQDTQSNLMTGWEDPGDFSPGDFGAGAPSASSNKNKKKEALRKKLKEAGGHFAEAGKALKNKPEVFLKAGEYNPYEFE